MNLKTQTGYRPLKIGSLIYKPNFRCLFNGKMSFCNTKSLLPSREDLKKLATRFSMVEVKKLMGRPLVKEGKRTKVITVRFTEREFKEILELEQQLGISHTEFIRMRVLANNRKIIIDSRLIIKYLDDSGAEMGRIGNNINQLAKHANVLRLKGELSPLVIDRFNNLFNEYIKVQQSMEAAFRKIIRAMGN